MLIWQRQENDVEPTNDQAPSASANVKTTLTTLCCLDDSDDKDAEPAPKEQHNLIINPKYHQEVVHDANHDSKITQKLLHLALA